MDPNDRIDWGSVVPSGTWFDVAPLSAVDGYAASNVYIDDDAMTLSTATIDAYESGWATATTTTDYVEYDTAEWPIRWNRNREISFTADNVQWGTLSGSWTGDSGRNYVWKIFSDDNITSAEESEEKELEESEELNSFLDELVVQDD